MPRSAAKCTVCTVCTLHTLHTVHTVHTHIGLREDPLAARALAPCRAVSKRASHRSLDLADLADLTDLANLADAGILAAKASPQAKCF